MSRQRELCKMSRRYVRSVIMSIVLAVCLVVPSRQDSLRAEDSGRRQHRRRLKGSDAPSLTPSAAIDPESIFRRPTPAPVGTAGGPGATKMKTKDISKATKIPKEMKSPKTPKSTMKGTPPPKSGILSKDGRPGAIADGGASSTSQDGVGSDSTSDQASGSSIGGAAVGAALAVVAVVGAIAAYVWFHKPHNEVRNVAAEGASVVERDEDAGEDFTDVSVVGTVIHDEGNVETFVTADAVAVVDDDNDIKKKFGK